MFKNFKMFVLRNVHRIITKKVFLKMINNMIPRNLMSKKTMNMRVFLKLIKTGTNRQPEIYNEELSNLTLILNTQQRKIFHEVQGWARKKHQSYEL